MLFKNREDAANQLAEALKEFQKRKNTFVVGIPRGGIEIGYHLSKRLQLPLHYILVKKIGHPEQPEYAIGVASLHDYYVDEVVIREDNISQSYIEQEVEKIRKNLIEQEKKYPSFDQGVYKDKTIILTDDGIATGKTLLLTIKLLKHKEPKKIIVAVPLGPSHSIEKIQDVADSVVCLYSPINFFGISQFYEEFKQLEDVDVEKYLREVNGI